MSLILDDITFGYSRERCILNHFTAEFPDRERTALTGENGTGKTTLARIIMGILPVQKPGRILLNGQCLNTLTMAQRGRKIGYVMQNPAQQIFADTVEKEIGFGLQFLELSEEERKRRCEKYLKVFDLEPYRTRYPQLLSHGEKRRLVLAAVLAMEPEYLILDEPTANLDFRSRRRLGEQLKDLQCGMMVITHDMDFVQEYCHGMVRMECAHGKI